MPDLNRQQIREILEYLEETTDIDALEVRRAIEHQGAILKGAPDTKEERKFGKVISVDEQKEFVEKLSEEMELSGRAREQFEWAMHSRNIGSTFRKMKEAKREDDDSESGSEDDEKPKQKGFWRTMTGI